ncbi:MAG: peptidylprolyl isomerase [Pseudomonadota bacterium]
MNRELPRNFAPAHRLVLLMVALLLPLGSPAARAELELLDGVAAIVNDDVVLLSELRTETEMIHQQLLRTQNQAPPREALLRQVLERLILDKLQLAIAQRAGAQVSESELNQAVAQIAEGQGLTVDQLYAQAAADGLDRGWVREKIRNELLISRVQQSIVNRRITVSDQEIDNFLSSTAAESLHAEELQIGHILLPLPAAADDRTVADAEARAEELREQILQGADFRQLAVLHSAGQHALQGGDLGWRSAAQLPPAFATALRDLEPGQVTAPIRTDTGLHLLKLYARRGGGESVLRQSRVRHILIKPSEIRSDDQAYELALQLRQRILSGESFSELAKEFSEDTGSALKGGDLGWSLPGKFVEEFARVADTIEVDQVSEPFRTQFGWHVLQVTERRDQDFSEEIRRNQARNALRQRKFGEELQIWLGEIRDEAFVEIKL